MSLTDLYQNTKSEKKPADDRVMYATHAQTLKGELEALTERITFLTNDVKKLENSVKALELVDLKSYTEKHQRIKDNYNQLVSSYNQSQAELKTVVMDISKRINDVEGKL
jgi:RNA polymerase-interacting CarD/CdnL/TRCF family regulator